MTDRIGARPSDRAGHERSQSSVSSPSGDHPSRGFTPGQWRFEAGTNEYGYQGDLSPILGTIRGAGEKPDGGEHIAVTVSDLPEAQANAHLIAAAPELYEALVLALNDLADKNDRLGICNPDLPQDDPLNVGERALEKAQGK